MSNEQKIQKLREKYNDAVPKSEYRKVVSAGRLPAYVVNDAPAIPATTTHQDVTSLDDLLGTVEPNEQPAAIPTAVDVQAIVAAALAEQAETFKAMIAAERQSHAAALQSARESSSAADPVEAGYNAAARNASKIGGLAKSIGHNLSRDRMTGERTDTTVTVEGLVLTINGQRVAIKTADDVTRIRESVASLDNRDWIAAQRAKAQQDS